MTDIFSFLGMKALHKIMLQIMLSASNSEVEIFLCVCLLRCYNWQTFLTLAFGDLK